jgi:KamA family protein
MPVNTQKRRKLMEQTKHLTWKEALDQSYRSVEDIGKVIRLSEAEKTKMAEIIKKYPMCVTPYYFSLIYADEKDGPIFRMAIPDVNEFSEGGEPDTSGEYQNTVITGMQHKYKQTALILSTDRCAMYCRHCFRKRMVGGDGNEVAKFLPAMAEYIKSHKEINNVLISGGDAFMNENAIIEKYLKYLVPLKNLDFIRFGTRMPVVLPQRITDDHELLSILEKYGKQKKIYIITQFNHPRELTPEAIGAIKALHEAGCSIRNQTVLLRGVNDNPDTLALLFNELTMQAVHPYYLFQCRPAKGVKNQFQLPLKKGVKIVDEAKSKMNGQAKAFRYCMSQKTGKIEILGLYPGQDLMLFKYHQAKHDRDASRIFAQRVADDQGWLDEIDQAG